MLSYKICDWRFQAMRPTTSTAVGKSPRHVDSKKLIDLRGIYWWETCAWFTFVNEFNSPFEIVIYQ